ncbi:unnamed protein product [Thlaspi arvense]|uniref:Uncharacterized protein n=1 Tax=Thlaspi arvense TaxID=13288 RepID=A0AAU9SL60_THLAR|nr:unnamed protein product [Thlaspi arvense]
MIKITVPRFDNTELIKGYNRTLIGRCMNLTRERRHETQYFEDKQDGGAKSYKGALGGSGESTKDKLDQQRSQGDSSKRKGKMVESREEDRAT